MPGVCKDPCEFPSVETDSGGRRLGATGVPHGRDLKSRGSFRLLVVVGAALVLAACGGSPSAAPDPGSPGGAGPAATVVNCGRALTFAAPPQRVVVLSPIIAQDMIALGLGNRIVGQSGTDYTAPPPETAGVPVLSRNNLTSTEVLLGARPDLVMSDLAYRLDPAQGGASLSRLQQAGVPSYIATAGCSTTSNGGKVADELTDVENLGRVFRVESQARALADRLRGDLADVARRVAGQPPVTVFEGTLYNAQFYPVSGKGLDALGLAGGTSIFPQVVDSNASVSKEEVVARDPQVIVAQNSSSAPSDPRQEIATVSSTFPTTAAVRDGRIYSIGYVASSEPGSAIETVGAVRELATFLHPTAFSG